MRIYFFQAGNGGLAASGFPLFFNEKFPGYFHDFFKIIINGFSYKNQC